MIVYWAAASGLGTIAIATQTSIGSKASTARRKIFHILSVAVYLPGFIFECDLIYLASGIAFAGQIALEVCHFSPNSYHYKICVTIFYINFRLYAS